MQVSVNFYENADADVDAALEEAYRRQQNLISHQRPHTVEQQLSELSAKLDKLIELLESKS